MSRLVLGLDIGESSLGGALLRLNDDDELEEILWANSRVFSGVIDPQKKVTLNSQRRGHRGQRKTIERRVRRRRRVENALVRAGLLPTQEKERDIVLGRSGAKLDPKYLNPYKIRARALDGPLEPFEIGRALQHLLQRRGFRSNRKAKLADLLGPKSEFRGDEELQAWIRDTKESNDAEDGQEEIESETDSKVKEDEPEAGSDADSDDPTKTLKAIESLKGKWERSGLPTIGAYLNKELAEGKKVRKRNRLSREWLEDEFEAIWDAQAKYHPHLLTEGAKSNLRISFEQRPLKAFRILLPKRGWLGTESERKHELRMTKACAILGPCKPVARRGHWVSQRFRIMETLRNLRLQIGNEVRPLTKEEYVPLADKMQSQGSMSWPRVRKEIGVGSGAKFTIETSEGSLKKLLGNSTEIKLKAILGPKWNDSLALPADVERDQREFMQDIETCDDPLKLFKMLQRPKPPTEKHPGNRIFPLTKRQAFDLLRESFSSQTTNYSVRAMRTLHKDMLAGKMPHEAKDDAVKAERPEGALERLPTPPALRNPRVHRALQEVRKVVNALIDKHGLPAEVRIELARELKENKPEREAHSKAIRANEKLNKDAEDWWRKQPGLNGHEVTRKDKLKHRLWDQQKTVCPYCLLCIGATDLLNDTADIDHVLPLTKGGDDAFSNKVLAHRHCNAEKGDRLPWEVWGHDKQAWLDRRAVIQAAGNRALLRRFDMEQVPENFIARQLADTRYITTEAVKYLEQLKGVKIWPTNGGATGFLRRTWELNGLLPKLETKKKISEEEKNRLDHRHHALDALVVAMTNPKRYRAALVAFRGRREGRDQAKARFYRPPVQKIMEVISHAQTSHALNKGILGPLHDASFYGRLERSGEGVYVRRIGVAELIKADVRRPDFEETRKNIAERVYDRDLRRALLDRLSQGDWVEAFKTPPLRLLDGKGNLMLVDTVRVKHPKRSDDSTINIDHPGDKDRRDRYVAPESNHHAEVIRLANGKLTHRVVRMIDAARAMRGNSSPYGLAVLPGEELVLCLGSDEIVEYDGEPMKVASIAMACVFLRGPNDTRSSNDTDPMPISGDPKLSKFGSKLVSDPLGNLSPYDGP